MSEYSVEALRSMAELLRATFGRAEEGGAANMLDAYADLREQIERAREGVTDEMVAAYVSAVNDHLGNMTEAEWQADRLDKHAHLARVARIGLTAVVHLLPSGECGGVNHIGELLAVIHGDGGHYQAEHGVQKAAKDALLKVIEMMTKIATNPPAQTAQVDGIAKAAAYIQKKADDYAAENCSSEPDTGAPVYHFGNAGMDYHHTLIELAEDVAGLSPPTAEPVTQGEAVACRYRFGDGNKGWLGWIYSDQHTKKTLPGDIVQVQQLYTHPAAPVGVPVAWQHKRRSEDYPDEWRECSKEAFDTINKTKDSPWIARELLAAAPSPGEPS
jgi:hypothetical protein